MALQYGSGQGDPRLREQICDVMALEGIDGPPRRRRRHRRLPAGRRPGHPHLLRPRRRGALRGAVVRRRARGLRGLPGRGRARRDGRRRAGARRRCAQAIAAVEGRGPDDQVPLHDPQLPQPRRRHACRLERRAEILDICRDAGVLVLEDNPYGLLGFDGEPMRAAARRRGRGRDLPRLVLQDLRARHARRLGAGAARRPREARARPGGRNAVPARLLPDGGRRRTSPSTTGRARSRRSGRCTASAATR